MMMGIMSFVGSNAQQKLISNFKKGNTFIEGSFGYSKSSNGTSSSFITPAAGMFVTDRVCVGLGAELSDSRSGASLFGRCYFMNYSRCKVFSQLDLSTKIDRANDAYVRSNSVNLGVGLNYFVSGKLALTTALANLANYTMYPVHGVVTSPSISVGINNVTNPFVAPSFGLLYRF